MTELQREWLRKRITKLKSKRRNVGPFRYRGITRTIEGMKAQLKADTWDDHFATPEEVNARSL